jgi:hypothetical protein
MRSSGHRTAWQRCMVRMVVYRIMYIGHNLDYMILCRLNFAVVHQVVHVEESSESLPRVIFPIIDLIHNCLCTVDLRYSRIQLIRCHLHRLVELNVLQVVLRPGNHVRPPYIELESKELPSGKEEQVGSKCCMHLWRFESGGSSNSASNKISDLGFRV